MRTITDVYTGTSALEFNGVAWNRTTYKQLRPRLIFDRFATVKSNAYHPGTTINFTIWDDLAVSETPLNEALDVDAEALADNLVQITLTEYGKAAVPTAKLRATNVNAVDGDVADIIAHNAAKTLDTLARTPMNAGDNVRYSTASGEGRNDSPQEIESDDVLNSDDTRYVVAKMRGDDVRGFGDGMEEFVGIIHPDVSYDYRNENNDAWADPVNYTTPERKWNGEVGKHNSVRFIESSRALVHSNTGSPSTTEVYNTLIFGQDALAKVWSNGAGYTGGAMPTVVISPLSDKLDRFRSVGWKWLGGYGRFREEALWRIMSGSLIDA